MRNLVNGCAKEADRLCALIPIVISNLEKLRFEPSGDALVVDGPSWGRQARGYTAYLTGGATGAIKAVLARGHQ